MFKFSILQIFRGKDIMPLIGSQMIQKKYAYIGMWLQKIMHK